MANEKEAVGGPALANPVVMPDGTAILSGPIPGGQVAAGMTQITPKSSDPESLKFAGVPGGMFTIYGSNFGPVGMVHVGPHQVTVTSWQDYRIKGLLPPGISVKQDVTITDGALTRTVIKYQEPKPIQAAPEPAIAK